MAGDWIKVDWATPEKPEVYQMAEILGLDRDMVIGKLLRVWGWFDRQSVDGNAPVTVRPLLNNLAGQSGFLEAMEAVGWLEVDENSIRMPKFDRHNGQSFIDGQLPEKKGGW